MTKHNLMMKKALNKVCNYNWVFLEIQILLTRVRNLLTQRKTQEKNYRFENLGSKISQFEKVNLSIKTVSYDKRDKKSLNLEKDGKMKPADLHKVIGEKTSQLENKQGKKTREKNEKQMPIKYN